jgi:enediyne biosynthesis protein E4
VRAASVIDSTADFEKVQSTHTAMQLKRHRLLAVPLTAGFFLLLLIPLASDEVRAGDKTGHRRGAIFSSQQPPRVRFTDITREAGLSFVHRNGAGGEKLLPETMGGGCAFLDYDSDGDQDLLLINSSEWPGASNQAATMALYQNDGRGKFKDVTKPAALDFSMYGMGVAAGDYDNDGRSDIFISAVGYNRLLHNEGGRFVDAGERAGAKGSSNQWSTSCGFVDYNNDGLLDLFVCNYVQWSREIDLEQNRQVPGIGRVYGPPFAFAGTHPYLYRNEGDGRFTEVSAPAGLRKQNPTTGQFLGKSLGVAPVDLDGDGWIDFVVANDTNPNQVFHNQKDGTFREIGGTSGLGYDAFGNVRGAMGIDTAWFGDDASLGIAIANFANEMNSFYVARPFSLQFKDEAPLNPVGVSSRTLLKFGLIFFDYDLDGWPDLLTSNGHLDADLTKARKGQGYAQPAQLFWNGGPHQEMTFVPVTEEHSGPDLFKPIVGRGATFADIDADGDLDVLMTQIAGLPLLLRNDQQTGHRFLRLKLTGTKSNRDAIGARVTLKGKDRIWQTQVMPTRSYLSQSELAVTIGFGDSNPPATLEIRWPSGRNQKAECEFNTFMTIKEPSE